MTTTTYHGSRNGGSTIVIDRFDGFGGLFSGSAEVARSHGDHVYEITSPRPLSAAKLFSILHTTHDAESEAAATAAYDAALKIADGCEEIAERIVSAECDHDDLSDEALAVLSARVDETWCVSWELQRLRGQLAARLGYTSVEMRDEHGQTWLCLPGCTIVRVG